jgi:hypothetical protein
MTYINTITDDPVQTMTLKLDNGDSVIFNLSYFESQKGWFYNITYGTFALYNRRIVTGVNMLRGFRNLLPFGFACITDDGYEPVFKEDFKNSRAKFLLLDETDIGKVEDILQQEQSILG